MSVSFRKFSFAPYIQVYIDIYIDKYTSIKYIDLL